MGQGIMIERVMFIGSKHLGVRTLEAIYSLSPKKLYSIVTLNDSKDVRCKLNEFEEFSKHTGIRYHALTKPSELETVVEEDAPEMCIVVGWYWIIKETLLKRVPKGFLGIHASLLPKYRGSAPLVWPIINGDKESGLSLFYFDKGMDTGDIVAQKHFSIMEDDTIAKVLSKAETLTIELLDENYPLLLKETAPRIPQKHNEATYCSQRRSEDGRINWQASNVEIYNAIRAQTHPYPGAFCFTEKGKKLTIWKARLFSQEYYGVPGLAVQVFDNYVVITCGRGAICLYKVQLESSEEEVASKILKYGKRLK